MYIENGNDIFFVKLYFSYNHDSQEKLFHLLRKFNFINFRP